MKVLMISTDRKIFEEGSAVRARMVDYAGLFKRLEIIVFAKKSDGFTVTEIASNCRAYPTNSFSSFSYVCGAIRLGKKLLNNGGHDWVITCQDPFETGLAGWRLAERFGAKLNLQIHTDVFSSFFGRESLKNKIRVWLAKKLLPQADGVRVVSERIKKSLAFLPLKTEPIVLPIFVGSKIKERGVIKIDLRQKYPQFDFVVLMASRLTREKNFQVALLALGQVVKTNSKIGLVIVGDGPERKNIEREIDRLGLTKNVILEKWNDDLSDYYQTADLFLLTSNYEGYGRTLIEAAQEGCPILTTNIGAVGEVLDETNSLICQVGDRQCFVEKLIYAHEHRSAIVALGEAARRAVEAEFNFTTEEYLRRYKASVLECLGT